ncbi:unnamed protein product [Hymenolepis diminuta]|uniref:Uncharacterized protein n=1 Tax=Hymenolepis diminuta TaxID=6216 RepID=A0A564Z766_HYMDI|nr:unnamed protein product [Hymenolepis diminuta]
MKKHALILSIKANQRNLDIARFLKVVRSFVCKVRKELPNENSGDGLAVTSKRKQHCQRSADLFRTPEFVIRVHGMIFPMIFKCLKEQ